MLPGKLDGVLTCVKWDTSSLAPFQRALNRADLLLSDQLWAHTPFTYQQEIQYYA